MITLKAALIAASAVGAVAVGGGATWAMTGSQQEAGLQSHDSAATAVRQLKDAAPSTAPTCLPAAKPGAKLPKVKPTGAKAPEAALPGAKLPKTELPAGTKLPEAKLPEAKLPTDKMPADVKQPKANVPGAAAPAKPAKPGTPSTLPTCLPDAKVKLPKGTPSTAPSVSVPAKPALPALPALDCSKLTAAVKIGGPVEKTVMLTKGLRYVSVTKGSKALEKQHVCAVTQKWTGKAGQWLTVERLKVPAHMTQEQLRRVLGLPEGGTAITVAGSVAWQAPGGNGVLALGPDGYWLFVNGSPVLAGNGLRDVTAALNRA
ncbi:hypothetical protein [Actinomadura fibrosa]|uniref:Uncharacterized protein n=1 Tax=Actinomadura fibrosa TaxID=111802 RepID=A0ABW2XJZ3_9ACTN|nr:hypothetical protein [Actinomadura fibrosa]